MKAIAVRVFQVLIAIWMKIKIMNKIAFSLIDYSPHLGKL